MKIDILIFSKDRACQLDLCIRSVMDKLHLDYNLYVQYTVSNDEFDKGYELLKNKYKSIEFIKEDNFKGTLLNIMSVKFDSVFCLFLVDDNVFINDVEKKEFEKLFKIYHEDKKIAVLSFRMHPEINYCFPARKEMVIPDFIKRDEYILWEWRKYDSFTCWGYPHAIDSHLYNREEMIELFRRIPFTNVNTLELNMTYNTPKDRPYMMAFTEAKIYNVQNNFVQVGNVHKSKDSVGELNKEFLVGKTISTENIYGIKDRAAHGQLDYVLI